MGCVQQAVLEFDVEVQAPWRPPLVAVPDVGAAASVRAPQPQPYPHPHPRPHPSRRSPSRVGVCAPPAPPARPVGPGRRETPRGAARGEALGAHPAVRRTSDRPGPRRRRSVRLRLTRRARRLTVVLALAAGVALGAWLGPLLGGGSGDSLRLAGESSVIVQSGDTLWSIATALDGAGDVRALVDEIQRLNDLDGAVLVPGQVLQLP